MNRKQCTIQSGSLPLLSALLLCLLSVVGCDDSLLDIGGDTESLPVEDANEDENLLEPSFIDLVNENMAIISATKKYDPYFREYSSRFLPQLDWRYLKSLCWVESSFRPNVTSPVNAMGLCQLMPPTYEQYKSAFGDSNASPFDPDYNIKYAAAHVQFLINFWRSPRPKEDRLKLSTASYNAGQGWLLEAQQLCSQQNGQAILYKEIIICLPQITGPDNSRETINHVKKTWRNWYALVITS